MKNLVLVGDFAEVEFLKNEKGGKPIARIDGVICFVCNKVKDFIAPRSVWLVEISEVKEKCFIITPFEKIKTPFENLKAIDKAIKHLVPEKKKRKKEVKHYSYKSANERDNGTI